MASSNVSTASSKISIKVKGFKIFPRPAVILEIEKEIAYEKVTVLHLRKNDTFDYTLTVKAEVNDY